MPPRKEIKTTKDKKRNAEDSYFVNDKKVEFFASGGDLLDCVLGGGWAENRIANIVGDKSAGKTGLTVEAAANYAQKYTDNKTSCIRYLEAESAFDKGYAAEMGLPVERTIFAEEDALAVEDTTRTVEGMYEYLEAICKHNQKTGERCLVIVDSLDALSDREEVKREIDKGSFGAAKAKKMSELFRKLVTDLADSNVTLMFISQIRDNIGVSFGKKHKRNGGKALDFYCSQVVWLAEVGKEKKKDKETGVERMIGVHVKAKCDKNKVSMPFRECQYYNLFAFGIDNLYSNMEFLKETNTIPFKALGLESSASTIKINNIIRKAWKPETTQEDWDKLCDILKAAAQKTWKAIDTRFLPPRRKY